MHSKKSAIFIFLSLAFIGLLAYLAHVASEFRKNNPAIYVLTGADSSTESTLVQFKIADTTLKIPRNYFWMMPAISQYYGEDLKLHDGSDKKQIDFSIELLLPNYEPRTEANKSIFDKPGNQYKVRILVESNSLTATTEKDMFNRQYRFSNKPIIKGPFDFKQYTNLGSSHVFRGSLQNPKDVATCSTPESAPNASCQSIAQIYPGMSMQFTFPFKYLPEIEIIRQKLIDILNSHRIDGPSFAFIP